MAYDRFDEQHTMTENPYAPPESSLDASRSAVDFTLHDPRQVPAGRGVSWVSEGFDHFRSAAGAWVLICIVGLAMMVVIGVVPYANFVNGLLTHVWTAGLILGCRAQDEGETIAVSHLFAGFRYRFGELVLLGLIIALLSWAVMFATMGSLFMPLMDASAGDEAAIQQVAAVLTSDPIGSFVLPLLIAMLFLIPIVMMAWFAPALIVLNDVGIFRAMRMSFSGCLRNTVPFLVYGIVLAVLFVLAAIPLMLGMLVIMPTFFGSIYRSYKDIYIRST